MSQIKDLEEKVYNILEKMEDNEKRAKAAAHLPGVSLAAVIIAKKRGQNPELADMAGLLHDLYVYNSGSYDDHAHRGADYAKEILEGMKLTSPEETKIICSAIWNHDTKAEVNEQMDEILKDADVIAHSLADHTKAVKEHEQQRYSKLCDEFGFS